MAISPSSPWGTSSVESSSFKIFISVPGIGNPTNLSLLAYLGADFFDSTSAILAARNNILLFPDGKIVKEWFLGLVKSIIVVRGDQPPDDKL